MLLKRKKQVALAILEVEPPLQVDSLKGSQLKILLHEILGFETIEVSNELKIRGLRGPQLGRLPHPLC